MAAATASAISSWPGAVLAAPGSGRGDRGSSAVAASFGGDASVGPACATSASRRPRVSRQVGRRGGNAQRRVDVPGIDPARIPTHVAAVMDGNGRWAQRRGLKRTEGHAAGEEALFDTVEGALDLGVEWLTVYAFSTENWKRPADEVRYLMGFNESILRAPPRRAERAGRAHPVHRPPRLAGAQAAAAPHGRVGRAHREQPHA